MNPIIANECVYGWLVNSDSLFEAVRNRLRWITAEELASSSNLPHRLSSYSTDTLSQNLSWHRLSFRARMNVEFKDVPKHHPHLNRVSARYCSPWAALSLLKFTPLCTLPIWGWRLRQCIMAIIVSESFRLNALISVPWWFPSSCSRSGTSKSRVSPTSRLTIAQIFCDFLCCAVYTLSLIAYT